MRAIDADAIPYTMLYKENWMGCTGIEKRGVWKDTIDAMPTIEERKTGKWIEVDDAYNRIRGRCSVCGWEAHMYEDDVVGMNFCPNCGADMRGEEE